MRMFFLRWLPRSCWRGAAARPLACRPHSSGRSTAAGIGWRSPRAPACERGPGAPGRPARSGRPPSLCAPTPWPCRARGCIAFGAFLVGDGDRDGFFGLDKLLLHVEEDLVEHLLGIFGPIDQVVEIRFDEGAESRKYAHRNPSGLRGPLQAYEKIRLVATPTPAVLRAPSHGLRSLLTGIGRALPAPRRHHHGWQWPLG